MPVLGPCLTVLSAKLAPHLGQTVTDEWRSCNDLMCSLLEILTSVFTFASKPHILSTSSLDKIVSLDCLMYRPRPEVIFAGSQY